MDHEDLKYSSRRSDLQQAVKELAEAGYEVVYWSIQSVVMGADFPTPEFCVRIKNDVHRWDGIGPTEDEAFEKALKAYGAR